MINENKKHEYWNHFIARWALEKIGGGYGSTGTKVTAAKLCKVKPIVWEDNIFWGDILLRYNGMSMTPEQMMEDSFNYEHCLGNFWGMLISIMAENHILI